MQCVLHDLTDVCYYANDGYFCCQKYISRVRTLGQVPYGSLPSLKVVNCFVLKIRLPGKSLKNILESDAFIQWLKWKTSSNSIALSSSEFWTANVHIWLHAELSAIAYSLNIVIKCRIFFLFKHSLISWALERSCKFFYGVPGKSGKVLYFLCRWQVALLSGAPTGNTIINTE